MPIRRQFGANTYDPSDFSGGAEDANAAQALADFFGLVNESNDAGRVGFWKGLAPAQAGIGKLAQQRQEQELAKQKAAMEAQKIWGNLFGIRMQNQGAYDVEAMRQNAAMQNRQAQDATQRYVAEGGWKSAEQVAREKAQAEAGWRGQADLTNRRGQDIQGQHWTAQNQIAQQGNVLKGQEIEQRGALGREEIAAREHIAARQAELEKLNQQIKERLGLLGIDVENRKITSGETVAGMKDATNRRGQDLGVETSKLDRDLKERLGIRTDETTRLGQATQKEIAEKKLLAEIEARVGQQQWQSGENEKERTRKGEQAREADIRQRELTDQKEQQAYNTTYQKLLADPMASPAAQASAALQANTESARRLRVLAKEFGEGTEADQIFNLTKLHEWQKAGTLQKQVELNRKIKERDKTRKQQGWNPKDYGIIGSLMGYR